MMNKLEIFNFCILISLGCLSVRWNVSLNPYSGANKPPMFGDYEAQRHWMEITYNLPVNEWYKNSSDNNLQYWGLDYPPLTAYHSWLCGYVANKINSDWVALNSSKGFESGQHKLFMRYTVMLVDLLLYIPAILIFFVKTLKNKSIQECLLLATVVLLYPGLIIIDHGHFQYNNASLGLQILAVSAIATGHDLWGSLIFVFALNYKQMELYHSVPFFCFLLGKCFRSQDENGFLKLFKIGFVVLLGFSLCWMPFLTNLETALQVLHRLFPFDRGLFEDKVSNIWCILDVLLKLKRKLAQEHLVLLSLASTVLAFLPSALDLLVKPSLEKFKFSLINCSLVFFLFSYQVHEKSILIPAISVILVFHDQPFLASWFLLISTFSMLPLLIKDLLFLPYAALSILFIVMVFIYVKLYPPTPTHWLLQILGILSVIGAVFLSITAVLVMAPSRYPDIFAVLISGYSCVHFVFFLVWFYYLQLKAGIAVDFEDRMKNKTSDKMTKKKERKQKYQRRKKSKKVD